MDPLYLKEAPPLDPEWLKHEEEAGFNNLKPAYASHTDRQSAYAKQMRQRNSDMTSPESRDHHLSQGVTTTNLSVASSVDGMAIPIIRYELEALNNCTVPATTTRRIALLYIHGGGLMVGEADSEELSCRRIVKDSGISNLVVYSIGYRLMPEYTARQCVADCVDAFESLRSTTEKDAKFLLLGSSSGGELAAFLSQVAPRDSISGVVLRGPVTSDAFSGVEYVPERWQSLHTSAAEPSFCNSLLGRMDRDVPRDGLDRMPLEATVDDLKSLPRTWIQVCTNDVLYSDGVCYARALEEAGVEVQIDVVRGWPHTFWLKAPSVPRALEAEQAMLKGLAWVAGC
jgi:acetyl esterase/lipase